MYNNFKSISKLFYQKLNYLCVLLQPKVRILAHITRNNSIQNLPQKKLSNLLK